MTVLYQGIASAMPQVAFYARAFPSRRIVRCNHIVILSGIRSPRCGDL